MTRDQWGDLAQRAVNTFVQGALAAAPIGPVADLSTWRSIAVSMGIGGLAALLSAAQSAARARTQNTRA